MKMQDRGLFARLLGLLAVCALATHTEIARAQQDGAAAEDAALEEVIVTAQRREERLQDVPLTVVALSSDQLEKSGVTNIFDLQGVVSGLTYSGIGNSTQPAIRGLSTLVSTNGSAPNIAAIVVRLKQGETPAAASAQAGSAIERKDRRVTLSPIGGGDVTATEQRIAYWLTGVSVLVLVIGLANSATLLLIRGAARRRDFAIRSALGATRGRLLEQAIVEATLLAATAIGVSPITIYRMLARGVIRASTACRHKIIPRSELERFLRETLE
jgi:hypothetical protein